MANAQPGGKAEAVNRREMRGTLRTQWERSQHPVGQPQGANKAGPKGRLRCVVGQCPRRGAKGAAHKTRTSPHQRTALGAPPQVSLYRTGEEREESGP